MYKKKPLKHKGDRWTHFHRQRQRKRGWKSCGCCSNENRKREFYWKHGVSN